LGTNFGACRLANSGARQVKKDVPLEGIRGIAALIVVLYHVFLGFFPDIHRAPFLRGTPLYVLMNGDAAVMVFFVLSGYVLTRGYFIVGDNRILLKGAMKRWPRLMGPVLLVVLVSYLLFKFHLYEFEQAGTISGSSWLIKFASGESYDTMMPVHFWDAFEEGSFLTFFRGDFHYNSSLWTMHPEFIGSFIAFGFAPILIEARKSSVILTVALIAIVAVLAGYLNVGAFIPSTLAAFPVGVGLAAMLPRDLAIPSRFGYPALLIALYLLGFSGRSTEAYSLLYYPTLIMHPGKLHIVGAAILIFVIETFPPIRNLLSGLLSRFLGELSFPIYLVHFLVICSLGSSIYIRFGAISAAVAAIACSTILSLPLIVFNKWWIKNVNEVTILIMRERPVANQLLAT
jgi:peptidoglycan/LPS O-acetylase OafA/YrhL